MADRYGVEDFEVIVEVLWNRLKEIRRYKNGEVYATFDYPDYWGLPRRIINSLPGEAVDRIQDELERPDDFSTKVQFRNALKYSLFLLAK